MLARLSSADAPLELAFPNREPQAEQSSRSSRTSHASCQEAEHAAWGNIPVLKAWWHVDHMDQPCAAG